MGSLCCTKPSPSEKNYQPKVFSTFTITNPNFVRNHSSFDEIYSLDKQKLGYGSYGDVKQPIFYKKSCKNHKQRLFAVIKHRQFMVL